jgi:hypothetical protein
MKNLETPIQATRALVQFCEDHGYPVCGLESVRECLQALTRADVEGAIGAFKGVPLGGMGCFNDWVPVPKNGSESPQILAELFEVLVKQWSGTMRGLFESL